MAEALNDTWNWKVYWGGSLSDINVLHWHGMKPGIGPWLECLVERPPPSRCPIELGGQANVTFLRQEAYYPLFTAALVADCGRMARDALAAYSSLLAHARMPGNGPPFPFFRGEGGTSVWPAQPRHRAGAWHTIIRPAPPAVFSEH